MLMVTHSDRLSQFITDREAPDGIIVEALCQDHVGTYVLPFPCRREGNAWYNTATSAALDCDVIGWREWQDRSRSGCADGDRQSVRVRRLRDTVGIITVAATR